MGFSVDKFLTRKPIDDEYECEQFTREVWLPLTGEDLAERLPEILDPRSSRHVHKSSRRQFEALVNPISPCIALMRSPGAQPHLGIFLEGRILHLTDVGALYVRPEVARMVYQKISYYR